MFFVAQIVRKEFKLGAIALWTLGLASISTTALAYGVSSKSKETKEILKQHHHQDGQAPSADLALRIVMSHAESKLSESQVQECKSWSSKAPSTRIGELIGEFYFGSSTGSASYIAFSCRESLHNDLESWNCVLARFSDKNGTKRVRTIGLVFDKQTLQLRPASIRCGK